MAAKARLALLDRAETMLAKATPTRVAVETVAWKWMAPALVAIWEVAEMAATPTDAAVIKMGP